jgi:predicted transcriptional regulator YheO
MANISPLLSAFVPVADLIGAAVGPDVEVVLHDLSTPLHSVVYVVNGHVTGRKVGQTFEHLFSDALKGRVASGDLIDNYYFKTAGKTIRSSSLMLRAPSGRLIGAICINIDVSKITAAIRDLSALLPGYVNSAPQVESHTLPETASALVNSMLEAMPERPTRSERLELIAFLISKNVFDMRGSIERVASRLGVANVTIYSDIKYIRTHPEEFQSLPQEPKP